jgi:anti-sigma factor RsiW
MNCRKAQEMLSAYHDGELSVADRAQVEAHLRGCPDCTALLESMARIDSAVEVPDPGPEYWERFNRRVEERIGREDSRSHANVESHPKRGWVRQQLRYLIPAAAAAVLIVVVIRNIGQGPGGPAPTPAPPATEVRRVPASPEAPAPAAREEKESAAQAGYPRAAEGKAVADKGRPHRGIPEASSPSGVSKEIPVPGPMAGEDSGGKEVFTDGPYRSAATKRKSEDARIQKDQAAGVAAPRTPEGGRSEEATMAMGDLRMRLPASGCEEARSLAAQERFKDAEAAQRACLAREDSPAAQESGLVFLAELLDRQRRFAEADTVIGEAQARFPGSRPLERYQQVRQQVQSGGIPYPTGR